MSGKYHLIANGRYNNTKIDSIQTDSQCHVDKTSTVNLPPGQDLCDEDEHRYMNQEEPQKSGEPSRDETINAEDLTKENPGHSSIQVFQAQKDT